MRTLAWALVACLILAQPAWAKVYSEAELSDFNLGGAKLGMTMDDAAGALAARKFIKDKSDPQPLTETWISEDKGTTITLQTNKGRKVIAIGLYSQLPSGSDLAFINKSVIPSLAERFGQPTKTDQAGEMVVMTYLTPSPGAGATSLSLRISKAGIDGRLGR